MAFISNNETIKNLCDRRAKILGQQDLHPLNGTLAKEYRHIEQELLHMSFPDDVECDNVQLLEE